MRFVIQIHTGHGPMHYDLMLEDGPALATWQLQAAPDKLDVGQSADARRLPDHRSVYLTYEGSVSKGRGSVEILDNGEYQTISRTPAGWAFKLAGGQLAGEYRLSRTNGDYWTLTRLA